MPIKKELLIALAVAGVMMTLNAGLFQRRSIRNSAKALMWFMTIRRVINEPEPRALPPDHVDHYRSI